MPCDTIRRINIQEEVRAQRERQEALERLEQELAAGLAQIIVANDGSIQILGSIPAGMHDACVLAALQQRNSEAFNYACQLAGVQATNFVQLHNNSHRN